MRDVFAPSDLCSRAATVRKAGGLVGPEPLDQPLGERSRIDRKLAGALDRRWFMSVWRSAWDRGKKPRRRAFHQSVRVPGEAQQPTGHWPCSGDVIGSSRLCSQFATCNPRPAACLPWPPQRNHMPERGFRFGHGLVRCSLRLLPGTRPKLNNRIVSLFSALC